MARLATPFLERITADPDRRRQALGSQIRHTERMTAEQAAEIIRGYATAKDYDDANTEMRGNVIGDLSDVPVPLTLAWAEHDTLVRRTPLSRAPAEVQAGRDAGRRPHPDLGPARDRHRADPDGSGSRAAPLAPFSAFPWRQSERSLYQRAVMTFLRV